THFGSRVFKVLGELSLRLIMGGVEISVKPDMHVEEKGAEKIIKLELSAEAITGEAVAILTQAMFEAVHEAKLKVAAKDVVCSDVPRRREYRGARMGSRMRA